MIAGVATTARELGSGEERLVSGVLTIEGNTWTFPWQYSDKGKVVFIRIVNIFSNRDTIDFHEGFSFDKIHWTATADGVERRVPAP